MTNLVLVALGGAIGASARYMFVQVIVRMFGTSFPFGTITVNILGSFLMGVAFGVFSRHLSHLEGVQVFFMVGVLGGFTTFSAFSVDVVHLWERGHIGLVSVYILASVVCSIFALIAGLTIVKVTA